MEPLPLCAALSPPYPTPVEPRPSSASLPPSPVEELACRGHLLGRRTVCEPGGWAEGKDTEHWTSAVLSRSVVSDTTRPHKL